MIAHAQSVPFQIEISPRLPTTSDELDVRISSYGSPPPVFQPPSVMNGAIVIGIQVLGGLGDEAWVQHLRLPVLAAGDYTMEVVSGQSFFTTVYAALAFNVQPATIQLLLQDHRFGVGVAASEGPSGAGQAVQLSDVSGYFWFFDPASPEIVVKVLDGRAVNGYYWVFIASLTDQAFSVLVYDDPGCYSLPNPSFCPPPRHYDSPSGRNTNFIDVAAFKD